MNRIGGEIPLYADKLLTEPRPWNKDWLAFSNGRAAIAWLLDRIDGGIAFKSAVVCAYTCPSLVKFLLERDLQVRMFDVWATADEIMAEVGQLPEPYLVIVPALFGADPLMAHYLAQIIGNGRVLVDASQTAFGHENIPTNLVDVLSGPRKTTSISDGAILALSKKPTEFERDSVATLESAVRPAIYKLAARALFSVEEHEEAALDFNEVSEGAWPSTPFRMIYHTRCQFRLIDKDWHINQRRSNASYLRERIKDASEVVIIIYEEHGVPYSLPIIVKDRANLLERLRQKRIFATALWPDAVCDPARHPVATWMAKYLISLPIDQRHTTEDMDRIAEVING